MGEIINLRTHRKALARKKTAAAAAANRARHGRTKAEKTETAARESLVERTLEGHRIDPKGGGKRPQP